LGSIAIGSSEILSTMNIAEPEHPQCLGVGIDSKSMWITHSGQNMLWLPSEYRPLCSSVCGTMICIGAGSGRVWTCSIGL
jgi:hypothetical protein